MEKIYVLGGISSVGKTTFVQQIADNVAQQGIDVLFMSLEMGQPELVAKFICRQTYIDGLKPVTSYDILDKKRNASLSGEIRGGLDIAIENYKALARNVIIKEGIGNMGTKEIGRFIENHIMNTGKVPVVVVDYLQILAPEKDAHTDKQRIDFTLTELKQISRDFVTPVLAISSLNRAAYNSPISLNSFKESGGIEYSADVLIGLQFHGCGGEKFDIDEAKTAYPRKIETTILKNRNWETGNSIVYQYFTKYQYFNEMGTI